MIEGSIYGIGVIVTFVLSFRLLTRIFYNAFPKGSIEGEEIAISVVSAIFVGAFWFMALPLALIYALFRYVVVPLILPNDIKRPTRRSEKSSKSKSWLRK
jgi:hypothetical protein